MDYQYNTMANYYVFTKKDGKKVMVAVSEIAAVEETNDNNTIVVLKNGKEYTSNIDFSLWEEKNFGKNKS